MFDQTKELPKIIVSDEEPTLKKKSPKKKSAPELPREEPIDNSPLTVKIYKVMVPSLLAWPPGKVVLNVTYTREKAERYIRFYPNLFIRTMMTIEEEETIINPTD